MNFKSSSLILALLPSVVLSGENEAIPSVDSNPKGGLAKDVIDLPPPKNSGKRWRLGVGFAPILGVDARFSKLGSFTRLLTPPPLGGGQNYEYHDGHVRLDSSDNAGGHTWNWSYDDPAQYDSVADAISFSISSELTGRTNMRDSDDLSPGFEFFGYYEMGQVSGLNFGAGPSRWGIKATLHYANISIDNSSSLAADVTSVRDSFHLNGVIPPLAPYSGSFNGPGPVLGDSPTRSTTIFSDAATITGSRDLDVDMLGFTIGPYLEVPISDRLFLSIESGFSLALMNGDYDYSSTTSVTGGGSQSRSGSGSETSLVPGFMIGLNANYQINNSWSAYGGARYQYYSDFEVSAGSSDAELDFGGAFVLSLGLGYRF